MNLMIAMLLAVTVEATAPKTVANAPTGTVSSVLSRVSSKTAYYDHAEGYAYFSGAVHVDDPEYQLHADRAYVFMDGTNSLKRIVALGHVAMTNGLRRAAGGKASYYKKTGLVVLSASDDAPAEVRDVAQDGDRVVRGEKIKFWTTSRQVEVISAVIDAPRSSATSGKDLKDVFGR